jgi:hypothetical protein
VIKSHVLYRLSYGLAKAARIAASALLSMTHFPETALRRPDDVQAQAVSLVMLGGPIP